MRAQQVQTERASETADRYLAECVRAALAETPCPPWPFAAPDTVITAVLPERASFHGIAALLCQAPQPLAGWPDAAAAPLREEMRLAALWEELHRSRIVDIIAQLAKAGVETLVMKGTALAYLHYPEPSARRRGDTDLLIHARDLAVTRKVLADAGCVARQHPLGLYFQESWLFDGGLGMQHVIDLHWEPVDHSVLQRVVNSGRYWENRVPLPRLSPHTSAPEGLVMLVHGALNQAWHAQRGFLVEGERLFGERRLIWSVDYARIIRDFGPADWDRLLTYCAERDAAAVVHAALDGAQRDLGIALPDGVLSRLAADGVGSRTVSYLANQSVIVDFMLNVQAAPTMAGRWRMLTSMAFPSRAHLQSKYPQFANWPVILLHMRRHFEALVRIARGEWRH